MFKVQKYLDEKVCLHPCFDRQMYLCRLRGEYVCASCGKYFTREQFEEIEKSRNNVRFDNNRPENNPEGFL